MDVPAGLGSRASLAVFIQIAAIAELLPALTTELLASL